MKAFQVASGLITHTTPLQESSQLLQLFSEEWGFIKIVLSPRRSAPQTFSPLLRIETEVVPSEKDIWKARAASILSSYEALRARRTTIQCACYAVLALTKILPPKQPCPEHYRLLLTFLRELSSCQDPLSLLSLFLIKACAIEGLISVAPATIPYFSEEERRDIATCLALELDEARNLCLGKSTLSSLITFLRKNHLPYLERIEGCERGDLNPHEVSLTTTSK